MSALALCELCAERDAELLVTVPMCGERPKYAVCTPCAPELGAYVVETEPLAADEGGE